MSKASECKSVDFKQFLYTNKHLNVISIEFSHVDNIRNTCRCFIAPEMFINFRNVCGCIKVLDMSILRLGIFVKH